VHELFQPLSEHPPSRVYIGKLVNTCTACAGEVSRMRRDRPKVNVGMLYGYRKAICLRSTGLRHGDHTAPGHIQPGPYTIPGFS
jgi:hypothetical protein